MSRTPPAPDDSSRTAGDSATSFSKDDRDALLDRLRSTVESHQMVSPGDLVLVALSGGPDSTALLHALYQLSGRLHLRLRAAHVHHGIRGEDADADARAAAALARKLRVPFSVHRVDAPAFARARGLSLEAAARELRYQWLDSVADRWGAARIATGHTSGDQAETVLLNLLRGAGPRGLAGIRPVRGRVIRPLIDATREEILRYCQAHGLAYRVDQSNFDLTILRNRIRHEVIPTLQKAQPAAASHLVRLAHIMRAEDEYMSGQAESALRSVAAQRPGEIGLSLGLLVALPAALKRRVIRAAIARVKGDALDIELERVDAVLRLAEAGAVGGVAELPGGLRAERTYGEIVLGLPAPQETPTSREWVLPVPGEIEIPELGIALTARHSRARRPPADAMVALLDAAKVAGPLVVRTRRRGDRFRPLGMGSAVKLQDFLVNAKIPRRERDRIPLVLSGGDIVWVVGSRIGEQHKVIDNTRRTIRLEAERIEREREVHDGE